MYVCVFVIGWTRVIIQPTFVEGKIGLCVYDCIVRACGKLCAVIHVHVTRRSIGASFSDKE